MMDMISSRLSALTFTLALFLGIMASPAYASERGFDMSGNPWTGLQVTLVILLVIILFTFGYMLLDKLEQRRVNRLKDSRNIDGLIKALRSPWLATKAARALGEIGDFEAVEPLINALSCKSAETREAVVDALGKIGDERAIDKLNTALEDRYVNVREHAQSSIEQIRKKTNVDGGGNSSA